MITSKCLDVFQHYDGDIDAWLRLGTADERLVMREEDWHLIQEIIQEVGAIKSGHVSADYITSVSKRLKNICSDQSVLNRLVELAGVQIGQLYMKG